MLEPRNRYESALWRWFRFAYRRPGVYVPAIIAAAPSVLITAILVFLIIMSRFGPLSITVSILGGLLELANCTLMRSSMDRFTANLLEAARMEIVAERRSFGDPWVTTDIHGESADMYN